METVAAKKTLWRVMAVIMLAAAVCLLICALHRPATLPQPWDGDAAALGLLLQEEAGEVRIIAVWEDSPARRAGLRPGDRLLTVNGQSVTDAAALEAILSQISPGAGVTFTAGRTGVNGAVEAVIAPR